MSTLRSNLIEPLSGTTVTLGASGDAVTVPAGATLKTNTAKDAGGNVLWTSDGSGNLSSVNSALSPHMVFIASQTASNSSSISFTTGFDNTYDEYIFHFVNIQPATDSAFFTFQVSSNGGTTYGMSILSTNMVSTVGEDGSNGRIEYVTAGDLANATGYQPIGLYIGSAADESFSGEMHFFEPAGFFPKHFYSVGSLCSSSVYVRNPMIGGMVHSTTAVNAIDFKMSTGNIANGTIRLYGIN